MNLQSAQDTIALGEKFGALLSPGSILALNGDLGAGKTTFVQGIARGLQIHDPIQSPTFTFLNSYEGILPLFHFDLYRLSKPADFHALGFDEYFYKGGLCVVEWAKRIHSLLPTHTLFCSFAYHAQGRHVTLHGSFPQELIASL